MSLHLVTIGKGPGPTLPEIESNTRNSSKGEVNEFCIRQCKCKFHEAILKLIARPPKQLFFEEFIFIAADATEKVHQPPQKHA